MNMLFAWWLVGLVVARRIGDGARRMMEEVFVPTSPTRPRLLEAVPEDYETARLYGSIPMLAYYYVDILIGTPPQRQSVIVDTGSVLLGFPCSECKSCGSHVDDVFQIEDSSSATWSSCKDDTCTGGCDSEQRCSYFQGYSEGSTIGGAFFSDYIALGDVERGNDFIMYDFIGCHTKETKLFKSQRANGILGMGRTSSQGTAIDALFGKAEDVDIRVLSLCLSDEGGEMYVGGYPPALLETELQWTEMIDADTYTIIIDSINSPDGTVITQVDGPALIDSGTTYSYLGRSVYGALLGHLTRACEASSVCVKQGGTPCWEGDFKEAPVLVLKIQDGVELPWHPEAYLSEVSPGLWCPAMEGQPSNNSVLGMSFLKNNVAVFDKRSFKFGYAPAACPRHLETEKPQFPPDEPLPNPETFNPSA